MSLVGFFKWYEYDIVAAQFLTKLKLHGSLHVFNQIGNLWLRATSTLWCHFRDSGPCIVGCVSGETLIKRISTIFYSFPSVKAKTSQMAKSMNIVYSFDSLTANYAQFWSRCRCIDRALEVLLLEILVDSESERQSFDCTGAKHYTKNAFRTMWIRVHSKRELTYGHRTN